MTTILDTNVLLDVMDETSEHYVWSVDQLAKAKSQGPVLVSDAVYSEFSVAIESIEEIDKILSDLALVRCGYSEQALFRAGKAYKLYKANKGTKVNVLPDFFIGALAETEDAPVVTRDPKKIKTYFPTVTLVTP